jgi:hypothetical protein
VPSAASPKEVAVCEAAIEVTDEESEDEYKLNVVRTPPPREKSPTAGELAPGELARDQRIAVCVLMKYLDMTAKLACTTVGANPQWFSNQGYWHLYLLKGMFGVWNSDGRADRVCTKTKSTPHTEACIKKAAQSGKSSSDVMKEVQTMYVARGDKDREPPCARHIRTLIASYGMKYVVGEASMMVRTPWHARWRCRFAEDWLDASIAFWKAVWYMDEKKFCLFDSFCGRWIFPNQSANIAFMLNMTDAEYIQWLKENKRREGDVPKSKARGLYPWFVWGAVG